MRTVTRKVLTGHKKFIEDQIMNLPVEPHGDWVPVDFPCTGEVDEESGKGRKEVAKRVEPIHPLDHGEY